MIVGSKAETIAVTGALRMARLVAGVAIAEPPIPPAPLPDPAPPPTAVVSPPAPPVSAAVPPVAAESPPVPSPAPPAPPVPVPIAPPVPPVLAGLESQAKPTRAEKLNTPTIPKNRLSMSSLPYSQKLLWQVLPPVHAELSMHGTHSPDDELVTTIS